MSSKIDERIVGMKFNGDQFNKGVADTSSALDKLKRALNLEGASKGLNDLDTAGKNFSLANLANGVQDIAGKFGALSVVGITALANIANKAVDAGLTIMRSLTIDPIKAGFAEYELKMGSIQTILANTARYGTQLPEVTANLDELNSYADKTIYNFGDMTKNIGLFTNAGIKINDATSMIKGFSNEAAASGTSAQGAAGAAYQLSQALSAGTIRLMDWRSLQNVGMGNKNMQNGLIEIAQAMGQFNDETTTAQAASENFNGSLETNWLSADVMSSYLKIMAGDMDAATQASLGLSDAQIANFAAQQKMSEEAATKVRTYTQLLGTMQESVGSGWSETFDILIGDFNTATDMWTAINDELGGIIGDMSQARNDLLRGFVDLGGRDAILSSFVNIWDAFQMYWMPIQSAFKEIFPPATAAGLMLIANRFKAFTESLKPTGETMALIKRTAMGFFAVLDIGKMILEQVWKVIKRLFGAVTDGSGSFLEASANVGDWLVSVRDAIKSGTALESFFKGLGDVLKWPIDRLRELGSWTTNAVGTWDLASAWNAVANAFKKIGEFLGPVWKELGNFFRDAKQVLGDFFKTLDFNVLVGLMNFGALGAIGIGLKKAFSFLKDKGIMGLIFGDKKDAGPGLIDTIKNVFGAITDTFSELQNTLKSATLIGIGIAIALITASVVALSFVDTGKLFITLGAMTIMFGQLSGMLIAIDKLTKTVKTSHMIGTAIALGLLAGAMILMSTAILILSTMSWEELARGLSAMALGLGLMVGAALLMDKIKYKLLEVAGPMVLFAGAILLLSAALKIMSTMSWDDILRSMSTLTGVMILLVSAGQLATKGMKGIGAMIALSFAIALISGALKVFSTMSWDDILRAGVVMAGAIGIIVGAMMLLDLMKNVPVGALTMLAMALVLNLLIAPFKAFAGFSWDEIGRMMVVLAGSLGILAAAMALMGIPVVALGGLALFVVSAGLMMLAPALALLGTMSWDAIGRGLTMLGASLAILAVGGLLLIPASIGFLLFGAAILLIGGGLLMAGQAIVLFTLGFSALVAAAALGAPQIKMALETIAASIPAMMAAFAQGIIDFALVIAGGAVQFTAAATTLIQALVLGLAQNGPLIIETITNLILQMLDAAILLIPKIVDLGTLIIIEFVNAMKILIPFIAEAGMSILLGVLSGIEAKLPGIVTKATDVIVAFVNSLGENGWRIIAAAGDAALKFVNGIGDYVNNNGWRFAAAGSKLFRAIIDAVSIAIERGGSDIRYAGARIGSALIEGAMNALGINSPSKVFRDYIMGSVFEGIEKGNRKNLYKVDKAGVAIGNTLVESTQKAVSHMRYDLPADFDFSPRIRPVLDLSNVEKNSALIGGMLNPPTLKVDDSYAYAASIAESQRQFEESRNGGDDDGPTGDVIYFTQNNNSPKALSAAEIYRQTQNQLSVVKNDQPTVKKGQPKNA